jgi:uncharacterized membrane protein YhaH (DUF805 family)
MADVFISYAREDHPRAEQVARGLQAMGLDVFWDTEIPPGQTWADYIEGKLAQCKSVIVLWSQHSTKSQWVREEARMGREKAKLIPAMLDASPMPFGFGEVQAADLSSWSGQPDHPQWRRLAQAVYAAVRGDDAPMPTPQAAQQQHAPPPPPPQAQPAYAPAYTPSAAPHASAGAGAEQLSPIGYIQKCLRLYADGKGRARRAEYGWFFLFSFVLAFVAGFTDALMSGVNPETGMANSYMFTIVIGLALICPAIAAASRRAHDFGQSGWLAILTAIPYLGFIASLVFIFVPGQPGQNQHGPNPKGV